MINDRFGMSLLIGSDGKIVCEYINAWGIHICVKSIKNDHISLEIVQQVRSLVQYISKCIVNDSD